MLLKRVQKTKRIKKLAIMDQDGANNKFLTLGNELVLTQGLILQMVTQMVTYLSYFEIFLEFIFLI